MSTLHHIRARFVAQVEQAAADLEHDMAGPVLDSLAYQQGQRDERARIIAQLQTWREAAPPDRDFNPLRNALTTIIRTLSS